MSFCGSGDRSEKKPYKNHMVRSSLLVFTVATTIKESAFVEKLQDKYEFRYSQTATIIIQVFI